MTMQLLDIRMNDGSRHFSELPEAVGFDEIRQHSAQLAGAIETGFISDDVTEMWLDLEYRGHAFSVNNQFGDYWFFVRDPECANPILSEIGNHFSSLLCK